MLALANRAIGKDERKDLRNAQKSNRDQFDEEAEGKAQGSKI
jgi:hypothetical protein